MLFVWSHLDPADCTTEGIFTYLPLALCPTASIVQHTLILSCNSNYFQYSPSEPTILPDIIHHLLLYIMNNPWMDNHSVFAGIRHGAQVPKFVLHSSHKNKYAPVSQSPVIVSLDPPASPRCAEHKVMPTLKAAKTQQRVSSVFATMFVCNSYFRDCASVWLTQDSD